MDERLLAQVRLPDFESVFIDDDPELESRYGERVPVLRDAGNGRDPKESWPAGTYVFRLQFEPGAISRHIEIVIDAPPTPSTTGGPAIETAP